MKRRITITVLLLVTLGIIFYYNSNENINLEVTTLADEHWALDGHTLIEDKNFEEIVEVFSVDSKGNILSIDLNDYLEILKSTEKLLNAINLKQFPSVSRDSYKGYETLSYNHLSHVLKISGDYKEAVSLNQNSDTLEIDLESLAYSNFDGGVSLPKKLLKHLDYDLDDQLKISINEFNDILLPEDKTSYLSFRAFVKSSVVLNNDRLMAIIPVFKKDVVGFIEVRSYLK